MFVHRLVVGATVAALGFQHSQIRNQAALIKSLHDALHLTATDLNTAYNTIASLERQLQSAINYPA